MHSDAITLNPCENQRDAPQNQTILYLDTLVLPPAFMFRASFCRFSPKFDIVDAIMHITTAMTHEYRATPALTMTRKRKTSGSFPPFVAV